MRGQTYYRLNKCGVEVQTDLLLSHLSELVEKGEVLGQVFAVGLDAVLHDGQEGLNEASDAGSAADVLHRTVHVVRAETREKGKLKMIQLVLLGHRSGPTHLNFKLPP